MYAFRYSRRTPDLAKNTIVDPLIVLVFKMRLGHQVTPVGGFVQFTGKPETTVTAGFKNIRPFARLQGDTVGAGETG